MAHGNDRNLSASSTSKPQLQPEKLAVADEDLYNTSSFSSSKKDVKRNKYALACAMLASMTSILLGYDIGVMSGATLYIKKQMHLSDVQVELVSGSIDLYSLIGSALAGRTADRIGRRYTIVLAGAIFFLGALLMGLATNYAFLMVGRFVAGIGVGYALMIAPVYTAELAPSSSRGFLTSFPEVFINTGVLLGYVSNLGFSKLPLGLGWRFMLGIGAVPAVGLAVGVLAMPESPRWLVMQGRLGEAKRVLYRTSDTEEEAELRLSGIKEVAGIPEECNDDVVEIPKSAHSHGEGVWRELLLRPTPSVRRVMIAALGLHFFQQSSGIDAVVLYSPRIFEKAGITRDTPKLLATVAVGFSKTLFILVATFLLDRIGRRPLLLASSFGMVFSLTILGTCLTLIDHAGGQDLKWAVALSIAMVLAFVGSFSIGLGPIAWVYSSEIFPLRLRAQGASMGVAVNRLMSGLISMTFLSLAKAMTTGGAFFLFASIAGLGWVFFFVFLPETHGRTLEEMDELFAGFRWRSGDTGGRKDDKKVELGAL